MSDEIFDETATGRLRRAFSLLGVDLTRFDGTIAHAADGTVHDLTELIADLERLRPEPEELPTLVRMHLRRHGGARREQAEEPGKGQEEAPADGRAEGPGDGQEEGPGNGQEEGPGNGQEEGPGNGQEEGPANGQEEGPGNGQAEGPRQETGDTRTGGSTALFEDARDRLFPFLTEPENLAQWNPQEFQLTAEIAPGLRQFVALRRPDGFALVGDKVLRDMGPAEAVREQALANLRGLPVEEHVTHEVEGGRCHVVAGTSPFNAARLAVLDRLIPELTGAPIPKDGVLVAVPHAYSLLFHPITDPAVLTGVLSFLMALAPKEYRNARLRVSPHVYWWHDGLLRPLTRLHDGDIVLDGDEDLRALIRRSRGAAPATDAAPAHGTKGDPRAHHYRFAHDVLKHAALTNGSFLLDMPKDEVDVLLGAFWDEAAQALAPEERLTGALPRGTLMEQGRHDVLVVVLPPAVRAGEAHFAAVVRHGGRDTCRYLTLERSVDPLTGEEGAVLCEWADETEHAVVRTGMARDPMAFVNAVVEHTRHTPGTHGPGTGERRGLRRLFKSR
ncbi:hypothetical protein H1R13_14370 [Streptomyces mexicanus]|uniref:Uncharacterized protein n=1 Tax=Streptomyces mexicanus TaxID=178566 RepID=A0A7X1I408_9ACTN|nr:hypothetical protein [Streptomyces mexicanus]MBC2866128.1 hypothetical protein [Streptomyces mexicanus]